MNTSRLLPIGLLDIMQCPSDAGALSEDEEASQLVCDTCHYRYRVEDGIPIMMLEEAIAAESD